MNRLFYQKILYMLQLGMIMSPDHTKITSDTTRDRTYMLFFVSFSACLPVCLFMAMNFTKFWFYVESYITANICCNRYHINRT